MIHKWKVHKYGYGAAGRDLSIRVSWVHTACGLPPREAPAPLNWVWYWSDVTCPECRAKLRVTR